MPITDWPLADQPRQKLLNLGVQYLTEAELLAILLQTGCKGKTALDLAKELLGIYGSLKNLMAAPKHQVLDHKGMGKMKYTALKAALELGQRALAIQLPNKLPLNSSHLTQKFLGSKLAHHSNEVFACVFLDSHYRLICFEEIFYGTIHQTNIYPREIVRRSLKYNAAKVVLAHNHPSGLASPSLADQETTLIIKQALDLIDVEVIDHIIVGQNEYYSFADHGLL